MDMEDEFLSVVPLVRFSALVDGMPFPERAGRDALGTLPSRAARWCDAVTSASSYGWWLYPPIDFDLLFDGSRFWWFCPSAFEGWITLEAAQFPDFASTFDASAPADARGYSPPFLTVLPEAGMIQVWTGLLARTAPGWSLLLRPPANFPNLNNIISFEGIIETDFWAGPLFTNFRLVRTNEPVSFRRNMPFAQAVPVQQFAYSDVTLNSVEIRVGITSLEDADWQGWMRDVVHPNTELAPELGRYAVAVRRRRKKEAQFGRCPVRKAP